MAAEQTTSAIMPINRLLDLTRRQDGIGEFIRYFLASFIALAIDFGLLMGLTELAGLHYQISAAIGFCTGGLFLYLVSISGVFMHRRIKNPGAEFSLFLAIGVAGLVINQLSMFTLVSGVGLYYPIAKVVTVGFVFFFNYGMRKALLFSGMGKQGKVL